MPADKETTKIESAREKGRALTGDDFKSSASKAALKGLVKKDNSRNSGTWGTAIGEQNRRPGYKRGGMVKKTGTAMLHKGEKVMTKAQTKKMQGKKCM